MKEKQSLHAIVQGRVQGVYFRAFVLGKALELGLTGFVRNLPSGDVELQAEGKREELERLVENIKTGPPEACVKNTILKWSEPSGSYKSFEIHY